LPETCDGDGPPTYQVTAAADAMSTEIVFDGARVPVRELAITATLGHFATPRLGWTITAGGIAAGSIEGRDLDGGATIAGALSWLPVYERPRRPFVSLSLSLGSALARGTTDDGVKAWWSAWDLRGGVMVGKTFAGHVVPYAAARVFGGPVFWRRGGQGVIGGDRRHVTVGAGLTVRLPARMDLSVEAMPLGEQSLSGGLTLHF
jgi:hypothetical protein